MCVYLLISYGQTYNLIFFEFFLKSKITIRISELYIYKINGHHSALAYMFKVLDNGWGFVSNDIYNIYDHFYINYINFSVCIDMKSSTF